MFEVSFSDPYTAIRDRDSERASCARRGHSHSGSRQRYTALCKRRGGVELRPVQFTWRRLCLLDFRDSYSAGAGCSITTATVSTAAATGGAAFFAAALLGLALATIRFAAFPAAFLAMGRAVRPFFFWTFGECLLRLAMVHPCSDWRYANALMPDQRTTGQPFYEFSTRTSLVFRNHCCSWSQQLPHNNQMNDDDEIHSPLTNGGPTHFDMDEAFSDACVRP
jgi:hypothetical protein